MSAFPHYSLLAFKHLIYDDILGWRSPVRMARWEKRGEWLYLETSQQDVSRGHGIFAGTFEIAYQYASLNVIEPDDPHVIWLIVPDAAGMVVEYEQGWRAQGAFAVQRVDDLRETARLILWAAEAGYPQIPAITGWAAAVKWGLWGMSALSREERFANKIGELWKNPEFRDNFRRYPGLARV